MCPGVSPGVGLWKQGLLMLQIMLWIQGKVPAEGKALFGKWPTKEQEHNEDKYKSLEPRD